MVWMGAGGCVQVHVRHDESGCGALLVLGQAGPGDKSGPRTKAAMRAGLPTGKLHAEQPAGRPAASGQPRRSGHQGGRGSMDLFNCSTALPPGSRHARQASPFTCETAAIATWPASSLEPPGAARRSQEEPEQPGGRSRSTRPSPQCAPVAQGKRVREAWNGWHRVAVT
jgi:hypothetical protein